MSRTAAHRKDMTNMLKKSTYLLLSLLLCIPLVFMIYFSLSINVETPTTSTLMGVSVMARDGYEFSYSDKEDLDIYLSAVSGARKIDRAVRDISSEQPTLVTYNELNREYVYNFYISDDAEECYFSDTNSDLYRIAKADAEKLAERKEYSFLYENYTVPTVKISAAGTENVYTAESDYEWKFMKNGEYSDGFLGETAENSVIKFGKDDSVSLEFSKNPTKCEIVVYKGETAVHFGNSAESMLELSEKLSYDSDTPLYCEISAEWVEGETANAYGKATYKAELLYDIPATYTLVDGKLSPGEFTIVKFKNLNDDQTVTFVSEIPMPATKIHSIGDKKFAFLPIDLSAKPGRYTISVVAGAEESSFGFTVNNKQFDESQIATAHGTSSYDVSKAEFDAIIKQLTERSENEKLWDDEKASGGTYKFANPVPGSEVAKPAFGTKVIADVNLKSATPYIQSGIILEVDQEKDVVATAAGKVVYVGELAYSGKTVVIDHGLGVLSIYQHLSQTAVNVGDSVKIKSVIGKTGETGYTFTQGIKFSMIMDGTYINPISNYTYGIQVS